MLAAVAAAAADWGAEWTPGVAGGRLYLPVVAGLRRGVLGGQVEVRAGAGGATRLTLVAETTHWRVHRSAAAVLVLGAAGALPVLLWPLSSELLALAPTTVDRSFSKTCSASSALVPVTTNRAARPSSRGRQVAAP